MVVLRIWSVIGCINIWGHLGKVWGKIRHGLLSTFNATMYVFGYDNKTKIMDILMANKIVEYQWKIKDFINMNDWYFVDLNSSKIKLI